jgi:phosphohistidine phosphatase
MATNQLVLLRHAKSDWSSNALTDHDRPLSQRGRRDAPRMGEWLAQSGYLPNAVYCSDAERTRETLDLVSSSPQWQAHEIPVTYSRDLYLASTSSIIEVVSTGYARYARVMVVGHNPGMDMVLHHFCPDVTLTASGKLMTTASAAVIEFDSPAMTGARLVDFKRPAELD